MTITVAKKIGQKLRAFDEHVWKPLDLEHYGRVLDWKIKTFALSASEKGEIIGMLTMKIEAGVTFINDLIITQSYRGKGVGSKLLTKAETIARVHGAHKIYLETGKSWPSVAFYEEKGFRITGELPKHFGKEDYIVMTKVL